MLRPGIVFLDAAALGDVNFFDLIKLGNLIVYQSTSSGQRIERIKSKEIIITNKVIIDKEVMDECPEIKLICISATGMNNVDLEYASKKGIIVKNVTGYSTDSVVQHTFGMLFSLLENLNYYNNYTKSGQYSESNLFTHHGKPFHEISGKKFGIIGMGTIGKKVAHIATAFGADVFYYSTSQKNFDTGYKHVPFNTLLKESDIITIHSPLNNETRNLLSYDQFCLMKRGSVIINVGRGGIINETDLAMALNEGKLGGAALDVLEKEPPDKSNPLFHINNPDSLIITPHIAWASIESRTRLMERIILNITEYLETKK